MPIRVHHQDSWDKVVRQVIRTEGVRRMRIVAAAANAADGLTDQYRVSVEGRKKLRRRGFRVTVITATTTAMAKNKKHHTLLRTFHHAGD